MRKITAIVILCAVAATLAFAADFWAKKPYSEWSGKEVKLLLSNSPWAKSFVLRRTAMTQTRREVGRFASAPGEGEGEPTIAYTVYIRTALPVREALVRSAQLVQNYERLHEAGRKAFHAKWDKFLKAGFEDKIIFQVMYEANTTEVDRQLANFWQNQNVQTIHDHAAMNGPDGQRVAPIAFWVGKGASREFQLAFPRPQGNFPPDAAVAIEFRHPNVTNEPATRVYLKYSFKEMNYQGTMTY